MMALTSQVDSYQSCTKAVPPPVIMAQPPPDLGQDIVVTLYSPDSIEEVVIALSASNSAEDVFTPEDVVVALTPPDSAEDSASFHQQGGLYFLLYFCLRNCSSWAMPASRNPAVCGWSAKGSRTFSFVTFGRCALKGYYEHFYAVCYKCCLSCTNACTKHVNL